MKDARLLPEFVYRVDRHDRILFVDNAWLGFAQKSGVPELTRSNIFGRSLYSFFSGGEMRYLYAALLERVRSARRRIIVPLRCDSPTRRRFMELEMTPLAHGGVEFRSRLLSRQERPPVPLLDPMVARTAESVAICSWCKKVHLQGVQWVEVEAAVVQLELYDSCKQPQVMHDICPSCSERLRGSLAAVNSVAFRPADQDEWEVMRAF